MLYSFSHASAEEKVHVDYEESFFLLLEAETVIYASLIDFGEEQGKPTWHRLSYLLKDTLFDR